MSPLNREQVALRKSKVRDRISELRERQTSIRKDYEYYSSTRFRALSQGNDAEVFWSRSQSPEQYHSRLTQVLREDITEDLVQTARRLPDNLGSRSIQPHQAKVAILADQFMWSTLNGSAQTIYLTPENYRELAVEVDLLLIVSTWRGRRNEWHGTTSPNSLVRTNVIPYFRSNGVPIAFYSKEDPPNYSVFLPLAQEADYIFTSDTRTIPKYLESCPKAKDVTALTFGINPLVHNPVASRRTRRQEILFAGSWLDHKYPNRKIGAVKLFDGVIEAGRDLLILDRNSDLGDPRYFYPETYLRHIGPGVDHADLLKIQRMTDVQLNLNSVNYSPTMFANRAVELQAMGSLVLSNYSLALNDMFPEVQLVDNANEVPFILDDLSGEELYRTQMTGLRRVYSNHLAFDRMGDILRTAGLSDNRRRLKVALSAENISSGVREIANKQTHGIVELIPKKRIQEERHNYDVVIPVSTDYEYAANYVEDLLNGFSFADVDFITKNGYEYGRKYHSEDDHEPVADARDIYRTAIWSDSSALEMYAKTDRVSGRGYSLDPFGVNIAPESSIEVSSFQPALTVVVPVYNNGSHLVNKCFRSLRRSTIFDRMEVILVDDGSTDNMTREIVQELAGRYVNVRSHYNEIGGSGSASRPRNQGLSLASAPYITYLDPDNEAVNDGFRLLLDRARNLDLDFAIGDMIKISTYKRYISNVKILDSVLEEDETCAKRVPLDVLGRINFQPMSIQALVANTEWLRSIGLHQPVGALGQDSLAFQQMLGRAKRIDTIKTPIHIYYGAVSNSVVNTIGPGFFRKYLPLEEARSSWLRADGLFDVYCRTRADSYFQGWFVNKFNKQVKQQDKGECYELLMRLASFYDIEVVPDNGAVETSPLTVVPRSSTGA